MYIFISGRVTPADVSNLEMEKSDAKNGTVAINGSSLADKGDNGSNGKSEDEKKKEKEEVKLVGFFEVVGTLSRSKSGPPFAYGGPALYAGWVKSLPSGKFFMFFFCRKMWPPGGVTTFPMLI